MNSSSKLLAWFDRVLAASGLIASFLFKNDDGSIKKDYLLLFASIAFIFFLSSLYETGSEIEKKVIRIVVYVMLVPAVVITISYLLVNPTSDASQASFTAFAIILTIVYLTIIGFATGVFTEVL